MLRLLKISLLSICLVTASINGIAEETLIQGNAFSYKGKTIEVRQYLDFFTFKSSVLEKMEIQSDGSFKFKFNVEKTGLF